MRTLAPNTSRRTLLGALTATTFSATTPLQNPALASIRNACGDGPVTLTRTREGRALSRARYHRAVAFFPSTGMNHGQFLYHAGITAQLGLSAHLLDVGFPDAWCARHIGLRVARSLAYANATGLGHQSPAMERLAEVLTPYSKWNRPHLFEPAPDDGGFAEPEIDGLLRALLDRVQRVTGHPRPRGWRSYGRFHA